MRLLNIALIVALGALLVSCSEKKYFTPAESKILGEAGISERLKAPIVQSNRFGAVLEDGSLLLKDGIFPINLKDNFIFLNTAGNLILVANYEDNALFVLNTDGKELYKFPFDFMPISAALRDEILAVVLADNSIVLWDIRTNERLFSHKSAITYTINANNAAPIFNASSVIFPVFDGKIIIVNLDNLRIARTIALSSGESFNNIIFIHLENDNLIIATNKKLMTLVADKDFSYDANIRDVAYVNGRIYVLTLEGEVVMLDLLLNELRKKKFQFATLSAIIAKDSIYTLESQGYLIKINPNDFMDSIYKLDIDEYKDSFYTNDVIYYDDKVLRFDEQNGQSK